MDWLFLSLTAATLWGGSNVVDKVIVTKHTPAPLIYAFFIGAYSLISALVVGATVSIQIWPIDATGLSGLSGVLYFIYILLYFAALRRADAAVVGALGQITPIFVALWDYLIIGEVFGQATYIGVIIIVLGSVLISLEYRQDAVKGSICCNSALQLMIVACFIRSLSDLLLKYTLVELGNWNSFFWPRLGFFAGALGVLAFTSGKHQVIKTVNTLGYRANLLIMGSEITALAGVLAITLAYGRGPLTLVSATGATQPLFILLFVWVINFVRQGTIPEQTNLKLWIIRLFLLLMIVLGVYLLGISKVG